ncbi:AAA family ATPase [Pseudomonas syringae]|uniref:ATP-binding protein n=3 Tax=Pseudomonas syringae TaxID=317 RepID=A0A656JUJ0_PSESF|nr:AAA family ATPase [Pseudomonas syringae]EPN54966.1 ATP-binding protein [Pseudomonas syringae pv. actinidiae ICMP 19096]EPM48303.1 ATP-binding protein [Pseudomonas syringae pv. actinidiae ICMP 19098]EPN00495.1 ATP-binding protein [Pseudomonas syringae pv. actinidiae ICMP 18804]EPN18522.1 ATP-binding protein [Pseudomonas syringae pv. actinidiae ICMP 19100]EPN25992.1 ATP-binding protein [Pseudomonas syringae pv. actinidiae ICMP 19099]
MNLTRLCLKNYRRFAEFDIEFDPRLTVISARNGQGKTSVLEAIVAALGPFVGSFDQGASRHIERTDARYARVGEGFESEQQFPVVISAEMSNPAKRWQRALNGPKSRTTTKEAEPLAAWGKELQLLLRNDSAISLPVVRYYSSRRLWVSHKNVSSKAILTESRTAGYEDCLSAFSTYVQLQEWMRKATLAVIQQKQQVGYEHSNLEPRLQGIRNAVNEVMAEEGWSDFHYSLTFEELSMFHTDHSALPLGLLSDGVRAMITLVADLALRCSRLNGHLKEQASLQTTGIVLIDEVDLHLHPAWQQRVVASLRKAFPNIQFIVSTHSPQVLSTVKRECIRMVFQDADENWQAACPPQEVKGVESAIALNDIMGVNPIPPVDEALWVAEYTAKIENGSHEDHNGLALRKKLLDFYGAQHQVILDADRLIRFQTFKLQKHSNTKG